MTEKVFVATRIRPPLSNSEAKTVCITPIDDHRVCVGGNRVFALDRVYDVAVDHHSIFTDQVLPLVESFLVGYNATVMAFGQTGAGKTHTMNALSPLVVASIAERLGGLDGISFQLLEVYGEVLHDLLAIAPPHASGTHSYDCGGSLQPAAVNKALQLLDGQNQTHVVGASRVKVRTLEEAQTILTHGNRVRATATTGMNATSSRSHCILTIFHQAKMSKLHLVDLAGSERNKKTHNVGVRFKESVGINTGLLALGNVIRALSKNAAFIPYRASKLTRLLQDSLGGNSRTLFLACVAPDASNLDETIRTLQYSSKAMQVLNEPLPNMDVLHARQQQQIKRMQTVLDLSSDEALHHYADGDAFAAEQGAEIQRLTARVIELEQGSEIHRLTQMIIELEQELRGAKLELKKDEVIFANQLKEAQRLHRENGRLASRVEDLEHQLEIAQRQQQENARHHYAPDSELIDRAVPFSAVALARSPAPHHYDRAEDEEDRRGVEDGYDADYVNLYSAHTSQVPSLLMQPTPSDKGRRSYSAATGGDGAPYAHDIPTAPRPSQFNTPHTGGHVLANKADGPYTSPRHHDESQSVAMPAVKHAIVTPPRKGLHYDAEDEVHRWTNRLADRLAIEDTVLHHHGTESPAATRGMLLTPPPVNVPLFASTSTCTPRMSSILASTPGRHVDAELMQSHQHSTAQNSELKVKLQGVLHRNLQLSEENFAMKEELRQIHDMLQF